MTGRRANTFFLITFHAFLLVSCDRKNNEVTHSSHLRPKVVSEQRSLPVKKAPPLQELELRLSVEGSTVAVLREREPLTVTISLRQRGFEPLRAGDRESEDQRLRTRVLAESSLRIVEQNQAMDELASPFLFERAHLQGDRATFVATLSDAALQGEGVREGVTLIAILEEKEGGTVLKSNPILVRLGSRHWQLLEASPESGWARLAQYHLVRGETNMAKTALVKLAAFPSQKVETLRLASNFFRLTGKLESAKEADRLLLLHVVWALRARDVPPEHELELPLLPAARGMRGDLSDPLISLLAETQGR